jgi:hypothetical protein
MCPTDLRRGDIDGSSEGEERMSWDLVFRAECPFKGCRYTSLHEDREAGVTAISAHFNEAHSDDRIREELAGRCLRQFNR